MKKKKEEKTIHDHLKKKKKKTFSSTKHIHDQTKRNPYVIDMPKAQIHIQNRDELFATPTYSEAKKIKKKKKPTQSHKYEKHCK